MRAAASVDRNEQLAALADPHRLAVLRRLMCGASTISKLGRELDHHPAWVRHHLKRLEAVGLAEFVEARTTGNYTEKFYRASAPAYAIHRVFGPDAGTGRTAMVMGSDDFALERLVDDANAAAGRQSITPAAIGSLDGLLALKQGLADVAGCHLYDAQAADYNLPFVAHIFPGRPMLGITLAHREQGLITAEGNPLDIRDVADLGRPGIRLAERNAGSGTRVWLDARLGALGIDRATIAGHGGELRTHHDVALAVAAGHADAGLGVRAAAEQMGLGFVPLFFERYDLFLDADRIDDPVLSPLLDRLATGSFRQEVRRIRGYDAGHTGEELSLTA
jgi:putative molybdopterin biosynthesis protein